MEIPRPSQELPCRALCQPQDLPREFAEQLLWGLASDEQLIEDEAFDTLIQGFETNESLNPYPVVCTLADSASSVALLLSGKTGVREGYRLHEHTQAVLKGFEQDYVSRFEDPKDRKLLRTTLLLQDIGKSLCIAHCGNRREQAPYNLAVMENLLLSVSEATLDGEEREVIRLLLGHDILGGVLKGYKGVSEDEAERRISALEETFPATHRRKCRQFLHAVYMADVTAYTSYRSYVASETGEEVACRPGLNGEHRVFKRAADGVIQFVDDDKNAMLVRLTGVGAR